MSVNRLYDLIDDCQEFTFAATLDTLEVDLNDVHIMSLHIHDKIEQLRLSTNRYLKAQKIIGILTALFGVIFLYNDITLFNILIAASSVIFIHIRGEYLDIIKNIKALTSIQINISKKLLSLRSSNCAH